MEALVLDVALGALESLEMRSLTWGFVDRSLNEAEAKEVIEAAFNASSLTDDAADALDAVCGASLVRMLTVDGERRYRTRFAEIVRLLFRLRQWFDSQSWQTAPTLVSDFRVDARTRHYPDRNISPTNAWVRINEQHRLSSFQRHVWHALIDGDSRFDLSQFQLDSSCRLLGAERGSGTIITAGTGSGKTLAFYLPALVGIAPEIRPEEWWTKAVCLYPRQELLKDQLSEAYGARASRRRCA